MTSVPVVSATLTGRTVREIVGNDSSGEWVEFVSSEWGCAWSELVGVTRTRERLPADPAFVVFDQAPDLTCRDCHGTGESIEVAAEGTFEGRHWTSYKLCPSCNGTGVSPVYAATWQHRVPYVGGGFSDWTDHPPMRAIAIDGRERRQVVGWRATDVTVLPVVAGWTGFKRDRPSEIKVYSDDGSAKCDPPIDGFELPADLRPGMCVLRLSGWEHLEQPHTEAVCPHCHGHLGDLDRLDEAFWFNGCVEPGSVPECPVCSGKPDTDGYPTGRVPLSVPDGVLSWMELV